MSYDVYAWRLRRQASMNPALVYSMLSQDLEVSDLDELDLGEIDDALSAQFPGWRSEDAPFLWEANSRWLVFNVPFSQAAQLVPALRSFGRRWGLTVFDPQVEDVPASQEKQARSARRSQERELQAVELTRLREAAAAGNPKAAYHLANRLAGGDGCRKDPLGAFRLYLKAAEAGHPDSMFNVAACYQYGDGVTQSLGEAIAWYTRAAEHDQTYAPFALGELYLGFGPLERDDARAKAYFEQALANGHPDARAALELLSLPDITLELKRKAWKFWNPRA